MVKLWLKTTPSTLYNLDFEIMINQYTITTLIAQWQRYQIKITVHIVVQRNFLPRTELYFSITNCIRHILLFHPLYLHFIFEQLGYCETLLLHLIGSCLFFRFFLLQWEISVHSLRVMILQVPKIFHLENMSCSLSRNYCTL